MSESTFTEAELHAYVDGRLPEGRQADVEAYLAAHPDEAARLATYRKQAEQLREVFAPVLSEPVPHDEYSRILEEEMKLSPDNVERATQLLSASRYLERIADLATNIAEDVIFLTAGEVVRHNIDLSEE